MPFDHPLWVLYSSGTTGLPKAIVQGQGGILLEHLKKARLHTDLRPEDRFFWFTTTGWMMWNFLVGGLLAGATIVLYDGQPDPHGMWRFAEEAGVTCFGTSAGFITACMKAGVEPAQEADLSRLRSLGSTGSPLPSEGFEWVYEHVKEDLWLYSTSGGTDLCTAFVGGCSVKPVYAGEIQARALGAAVEAWDPDGRPLIGEVGELVITQPMPSMPIYFWNDPDGERYRRSYFDTYPGVWRHGDWIKINERGGSVIYGRSDSTINRQGVRIGTSEIYSAVEGVPEVLDSLVVDVPTPDGADSSMWLFVVTADGSELDDDAGAGAEAPPARELLAATRAQPDRGRVGDTEDAVGQEARGAGEEDPHGRGSRDRRQPRLAGQSRRARLLHRAGGHPRSRPSRTARGRGVASSLRISSAQKSSASASAAASIVSGRSRRRWWKGARPSSSRHVTVREG